MRISVIVRAGHEAGLGHLIRGHTFATAAVRRGHAVQFISITDTSNLAIDQIPSIKYLNYSTLEQTYEYLYKFNPDLVVIDLIDLDLKDAQFIHRLNAANVCLSPLFEHKDIIHFHFARAHLSEWPPHVKLFVGFDYLIISDYIKRSGDSHFRSLLNKNPLPISICMGGADPTNYTYQALEALSNTQNIHPHIFIGPSYIHAINDIKDLSRYFPAFTLHISPNRIWSYMNSIPIAILSGGLMAFESVQAGIPNINVVRSGEQKSLLSELERLGTCWIAGISKESGFIKMRNIVHSLEKNRDKIMKMRNNCLSLNLKNGANNCLEVLEKGI